MSNAPEQESRTAPPIKLINRTRRPVCFRAEGKTIRLGPGEQSTELAAHCAVATGVRALCDKGVLALVGPPPARRSNEEREDAGARRAARGSARGGAGRFEPKSAARIGEE